MKLTYKAPKMDAREYAHLENVFTHCDKTEGNCTAGGKCGVCGCDIDVGVGCPNFCGALPNSTINAYVCKGDHGGASQVDSGIIEL